MYMFFCFDNFIVFFFKARGPTIKLKTKRDAAFPDQTTAELNFGEMPMKNTIFTSTGFSPVLALIIPGP